MIIGLVRRLALLLLGILAVGTDHVATASEPLREFYVYWTSDAQWCGATDLKQYQKNLETNEAQQPDVTEGNDVIARGILALAGEKISWIEDYYDAVEGEIITTTRHQIGFDGAITSARHSYTRSEGIGQVFTETAIYKIINGKYVELSPFPLCLMRGRNCERTWTKALIG